MESAIYIWDPVDYNLPDMPKPIIWTIQDVMVKLRAATGNLTQDDLAEVAGVSVSTVRRFENGEKLNQSTLEKIAGVFGLKKNPYALYDLIPTSTNQSDAPAYPSDLQMIIDRWPRLLETTKESARELVESDVHQLRGDSSQGETVVPEIQAPASRTPPVRQVRHRGRHQAR